MRALAKGDRLCGIALNAICLEGCSCTALGYVAISFVRRSKGYPITPWSTSQRVRVQRKVLAKKL
jgi:hypothetical protein